MVTTSDMAVFQQQLRQEVADVMQQFRTVMNERINGRLDMLNSINPMSSSHTKSAISSQESGKETMIRESSEVSCQTCTYGCKHGQTMESEF